MESIESISPFFQQWCVDATRLRRTFTETEIIYEARRLGEIVGIVEDAERECAFLRAMKHEAAAKLHMHSDKA